MMTGHVQLVVTPPEPFGQALAQRMGARTTHGVLIEIVSQAKSSLLIATPFIFISPETAIGPLVMALNCATERSVIVDIISSPESLDRLKSALPNLVHRPQINLFRPRAEIITDSILGSHAKVVIADESNAYIGSANLTDPGLKNNLEMGVIVHGSLAQAAAMFWKELEQLGFLERVEK